MAFGWRAVVIAVYGNTIRLVIKRNLTDIHTNIMNMMSVALSNGESASQPANAHGQTNQFYNRKRVSFR